MVEATPALRGSASCILAPQRVDREKMVRRVDVPSPEHPFMKVKLPPKPPEPTPGDLNFTPKVFIECLFF
jgi:hypothetical protein